MRTGLALVLMAIVISACSTSAAPARSTASVPVTAPPSAAVTGRPSFTETFSAAPTSGPSTSAAGDAPDSPCARVSNDDIESVTGATSIVFLGAAGADDHIACDWQVTPDGLVIMEIFKDTAAQGESAAWTLFQADPAVSGVGDEAHWDPSGHLLLVKDGDSFVMFSVGKTGVDNSQAETAAFAKRVEPKLDL